MAKSRRLNPEIPLASMADIAFLLLIFFLVTTTMDVDKGITTKLPPMPEENQPPIIADVNQRNVLPILINARDQMQVKGELLTVKELKQKTIEFLDNNGRNPNLSDNPEKAVISLKNDKGTSYNMYVQVQNELKAAYNFLRNREAMTRYGKKYDALAIDQQEVVRKVYPIKVSEAEPEDLAAKVK